MIAAGRLATSFAQGCQPRQRLSVSDWSDANRVLTSEGSSEPGPWRTSRTPYLREIMDSLSDPEVRSVVVIKSAQVGLTEVGLNWIGYTMDHSPCPMLVVVPTLEVRKRWAMQRLKPLLDTLPVLRSVGLRSRTAANSEDIKSFPGGLLVLGGANSASSLASMPIKRTVLDEVDRYPWQVGSEGDPLGLIRERQKTFSDRCELLISTPTMRDASRIEEEYELSDKRRYHVPCPHCAHMQHLKWANLKWDCPVANAWYVCEECGGVIEESSKQSMLRAGQWIAERQHVRRRRGYHINGLYAPPGLGHTWLEMAQEWARVHNDPIKLKRFVNTQLGESWEDKKRAIKSELLAERADDYVTRTVPPGALVLTAGVDVQPDRLEAQVVGWGRGQRSWVIDYIVLPGDPSMPAVWMALTEYLNTPLRNAWGMDMRIQATAIDTGGHNTHDVYMYVRSRAARRLMAIKGSSTPNKPVLSARPTAQDINWRGQKIKEGVELWTVGADTAKDVLYNQLAADGGLPASERRVRFPAGLELDYYHGLVSEAYDPERNRWVKKSGVRNEPLDTRNYALAASHHPEVRVHAMRAADWDALERVLQPAEPVAQAAPEPDSEPTAAPAPQAAARQNYTNMMMRRRPRR